MGGLTVTLLIAVFGASSSAIAGTDREAAISGEGYPRRSVRLHNYNNWGLGNPSDPAHVLQQRLELLARRDNITFTEHYEHPNIVKGWKKVGTRSLKALNPKAKIYRLYDLCCKNTWDSDWNNPMDTKYLQTPLARVVIDTKDWWLRDGAGTVVRENEYTWFLDVGKPGLKEAFLQNMLDRLAGKGFDGVVFDYWWPTISHWLQGRPRPPAYATDDDWLTKAWQPFISYVMDGLHKAGYRVIGNCAGEYVNTDPKQIWQRSKVDGTIYEQGAVGWDGEWLPGKRIEQRIESLYRDPLEVWQADGGLVAAGFKPSDHISSDEDCDRKQKISLAMYYIGIPRSQANRCYHHKYDGKVHWQPLWEFYIGTPAGSAVQIYREGKKKYAWVRKFTQGIVLLNYESVENITYSLDRRYRNSEGGAVSGDVILPPHTAMILALDGSEAP